MSTLIEAAKAALEALENLEGIDTETECVTVDVGTEIEDLREAIAEAEADKAERETVGCMPHGWVVNWPSPGGGTKPVYHASSIKPKFGAELDGKLTMYSVYTRPDQPLEQPKAVPLTNDFLQAGDYHLLHNFVETTEDNEGYKLKKSEIKRLAELGVLQSHGFGRYSVTMFGHWVHERYWEQNPTLPLKTNSDRDADMHARSDP